ncbi:hypothetical protein ANCCEY_10738, partial [Ancylostoma ceylanicum]
MAVLKEVKATSKTSPSLIRHRARQLALRIFRHIGDVSMGLALEAIVAIEEKTLLAAHVAMLLGRYDQAEQLFLKSSQPKEALS